MTCFREALAAKPARAVKLKRDLKSMMGDVQLGNVNVEVGSGRDGLSTPEPGWATP